MAKLKSLRISMTTSAAIVDGHTRRTTTKRVLDDISKEQLPVAWLRCEKKTVVLTRSTKLGRNRALASPRCNFLAQSGVV